MATDKFIPEALSEARRLVYGPVADGYALLELVSTAGGDSPLATLALSTMERIVTAFDQYEHQLAKHGALYVDHSASGSTLASGVSRGNPQGSRQETELFEDGHEGGMGGTPMERSAADPVLSCSHSSDGPAGPSMDAENGSQIVHCPPLRALENLSPTA